jgi:hypothetical protein
MWFRQSALGELAGLQRMDINLDAQTIRFERQLAEQRGGGFTVAPPKSDAGKRIVVMPDTIVPIISQHMHNYVAPGPDSLVFTSAAGRCDIRISAPESGCPAFARRVFR